MPRIPGQAFRKRLRGHDVPHDVKVFFVKLHRKFQKVRTALNGLLSDDPWAVLKLFGLRNWTPNKHEADRSRPIHVIYRPIDPEDWPLTDDKGETYRPGRSPVENDREFTAYIVNSPQTLNMSGPDRKRKVIPDHPPLGPEDYCLGEKVPPAESDPELESIMVEEARNRWRP